MQYVCEVPLLKTIKHLIELGHPNVAFIAGDIASSAVSQRYQGYLQILKNFQIELNEQNIFHGDLSMESGYSIAKDYVSRIAYLPSAAVVANDLMAIGFMDGLKENGIKIPDDLSIVSFDNIVFSALHDINLTTVDQHSQAMSEHAAKMILQRIEDSNAAPNRTMLEPELIVRGTTAKYISQQ